MSSEHNLKSGDRVDIVCSTKVGHIYLFASAVNKSNAQRVDGMAELDQDDLKILIADLSRYVH